MAQSHRFFSPLSLFSLSFPYFKSGKRRGEEGLRLSLLLLHVPSFNFTNGFFAEKEEEARREKIIWNFFPSLALSSQSPRMLIFSPSSSSFPTYFISQKKRKGTIFVVRAFLKCLFSKCGKGREEKRRRRDCVRNMVGIPRQIRRRKREKGKDYVTHVIRERWTIGGEKGEEEEEGPFFSLLHPHSSSSQPRFVKRIWKNSL